MTMGQKKIVVNIDPMGNVKVEAQNFNGVGCTDATSGIEKALLPGTGGRVVRDLKGEYYEQTAQQGEQVRQW